MTSHLLFIVMLVNIVQAQHCTRGNMEWKALSDKLLIVNFDTGYSLHCGKLEFLALKWSVTEFFMD